MTEQSFTSSNFRITDEQRARAAAVLRGLAEQIENPQSGTLPLNALHLNIESDRKHMDDPDLAHFPSSGAAADVIGETGRQVEILVGFGSPKSGWRWTR